MARFIGVIEENRPDFVLSLPINDNYSISRRLLNKYYSNVSGLRYKPAHLDNYHCVPIDEHQQFIIGEENFKFDYIYVVHHLVHPAVPTTTTTPLRPQRRCRDYCKLLFFAVFAIQTAVFTGILSAEYAFLSSAKSTTTMVIKNIFFLLSWVALAIFAVHQIREAIVDFIIECCTK